MKRSPKSAIVIFTEVEDDDTTCEGNRERRLPESERLQIVEELLASLEPAADDDVDAAWTAEIERRS